MIKKLLIVAAIAIFPVLIPVSVGAVDVTSDRICQKADHYGSVNDPESGRSAICADRSAAPNENPIFGPNGIITSVINILSLVAGIAAVIIIILAGLRFVTSGTNPQDVSNARERIIYAAVGLVVAAVAQVMVRFIIGKADLL